MLFGPPLSLLLLPFLLLSLPIYLLSYPFKRGLPHGIILLLHILIRLRILRPFIADVGVISAFGLRVLEYLIGLFDNNEAVIEFLFLLYL